MTERSGALIVSEGQTVQSYLNKALLKREGVGINIVEMQDQGITAGP